LTGEKEVDLEMSIFESGSELISTISIQQNKNNGKVQLWARKLSEQQTM
jgi:hypothetical protein